MELESIFWGRLRVLNTRTTRLEGRVSTLEDQSTKLSQRSDDRWSQVKRLAELTVPLGSIIGFLARYWGLLILVVTPLWALALPSLLWLWRALTSSIGYLAGMLG